MIPLLRTLTRKSKLGFGKYKDYTIQKLLDMKGNKHRIITDSYFSLSSINYIEDILIEVGITKKYRIKKPSINKDMRRKFYTETGVEKRMPSKIIERMKRKTIFKSPSKAYLQSKNQGK